MRPGPINVIFDTDMCLDPDDETALAIVHALQARNEANLIAVTVSLQEKWCAPYVDILDTFYGHSNIPIGTVRNGPTFDFAVQKILAGLGLHKPKGEPARENFAKYFEGLKNPNGTPVYPHHLVDGDKAPPAVYLLRKSLAAQRNDSVVVIEVGNSSNIAALLDSRPDNISSLDGVELVRKKVRYLSMMAGNFKDTRSAIGLIPKGAGLNIFEAVKAADTVFKRWPTEIFVSGVEVGESIRFPCSSIQRDFNYVDHHPIAESYRYIFQIATDDPTGIKCKYSHHTEDPTATLYGLRPDETYFSLSKPGTITVLPSGNIRFDEDPEGKQFYLMVNDVQRARVQEAIVTLVSQPPAFGADATRASVRH